MFARGLRGYLAASILQGVVGFATLMAFTRLMSASDFGCYVLALGVSNLAYTLSFTWMEAAMARFYPAERWINPEAPILYGTLYRIFVVIGLLMLAAAGAVLLWPTPAGRQGLTLAIGLGLLSAAPRSLVKLVQEQRRSEGRVVEASRIDMLQTGGGFVLAVVFALVGLRGGAPLLGAGMMAVVILPFVVREDWGRAVRGQFNVAAAKTYAAYGYPVGLSLIMTLALYTVDRFMIAHYLNEASAGAYHAGFSIASRVIDVVFIWFAAAGAPAMINALESGGETALREEARRQLTSMALIQFPAVAGLISVAGPLSSILIGGDLRAPALSITPLVTLGALFSGLNNAYFLLPFNLSKRTGLLVVAMSVPAAVNIVLNYTLIPIYGLMGAAMAYVLSFVVGIATSYLLSFRVGPLPVPALELAKIAGSSSLMAVVLALLPSFGALDLLIKPITGLLVYGLFAYGLDLGGARRLIDGHVARALLKPEPEL